MVALCLGCEDYAWLLLFICFALFFASRKKSHRHYILILAIAFFAGYLRLQGELAEGRRYDEFNGSFIEFEGYVKSTEMRKYGKQRSLVGIKKADIKELIGEDIFLYTGSYPRISKADTIKSACRLERPEPFDGFRYDRYLQSQNLFVTCQSFDFEVRAGEPFFSNSPLEYIRVKVDRQVKRLWPNPTSSLVAGLLMGTRESFPSKTLDDFRRSGITHIIALSGFNITILIVFLEKVMINLLIPLRPRLYIIFAGIFLFTVLVGSSPSIVRAAIMGSLVLLAKNIARDSSPLRIMLATAAVMTAFNPFILLYDLAFQLSFLSTLGLLYFTDILEKPLTFLPDFFAIKESFVTTLSATAAVLPLIIYQFGSLSLVAPLANVMILPLIPWLMLLGLLATVFSWFSVLAAQPFIYLTAMGSQYLLNVSSLMARPSWSALPIGLSLVGMISLYGLLAIVLFYAKLPTKTYT